MRKKIAILLSYCALLLATKGIAQGNSLSKQDIAEINQMVEDLAANDRFSGTVLIAKGNKILYQKAVGWADKALDQQSNINTKFNLASMNKMFTGIAIAQLAEKNKLSYSDKLIKHLPQLSQATFGEITLAQLLTHTAGTGDIFQFPGFMEIKDTAKTIGGYVNLGINEPLLFAPGARFEYSNYGYILLGAVIEQVSGMRYFDYVKKNIFTVAGMKNTDSYATDQSHPNMAIGYALPPPMPGEGPKPIAEMPEREPNTKMIEVQGTSAGGGYSSAIDLFKFSRALTSPKLLSASSVAMVTTGKIAMPRPPMPPGAPPMLEIKYGYGFGELYKGNVRIIGHNGGAPGVDVQMDIFPDLGYTVVVLSNYDWSVMPIIRLIEDRITASQH
jgi:CubicO group peptidase (beta-lactamase class C family)